MKPTLEQVKAFMETDLEAAKPPSPYDIALALTSALLAAGRYGDDPTAACEMGWTMVIPFYQGQLAYEKQGRMLFDLTRHASQAEGEMSHEEARAYVTGGETGNMGEVDGQAPLATFHVAAGPAVDIEQVRARQQLIADATTKMQAAAAALDLARTTNTDSKDYAKLVAAAQRMFEETAAEQSAAYL